MKRRFGIIGLAALMVSSLLVFSCKLSTADLAKEVQAHMIETWEKDGTPIKITKDLSLVKKTDTEYSGLVTLSSNGETEEARVRVVYDGESFEWELVDL
ncbi:hypothetical protein ACYULU_06535 [Breznakiellaceae bacterium SP9]